jgi:hypothetical protein
MEGGRAQRLEAILPHDRDLGLVLPRDVEEVERLRAEMFEQLAPATEGPVVNTRRKRRGRLVFGDATE